MFTLITEIVVFSGIVFPKLMLYNVTAANETTAPIIAAMIIPVMNLFLVIPFTFLDFFTVFPSELNS